MAPVYTFVSVAEIDERMIFLVFTIRLKGGWRVVRPITARYMHAKEVASYEKENPEL